MPRGGLRNPKGGRPLGAKDKFPRAAKDDERIKQFVAQVEDAEFFVTDPQTKVYKGNSRELMVDIYKAEQVPLKYRMYAAAKMIEYEIVLPVARTDGYRDSGEALLAAILKLKDVDEDDMKPPPQLIAPALPRPRVRPKPEPPVIDGSASTPSVELGAKSGGNAGVGEADQHHTHKSTNKLVADSEHSGGNSEPEPPAEISQEEARYAAALPPHLLPARWRRD